MKQQSLLCLLVTIFVSWSISANALDTTEPFELGFTDYEMYSSMGGANLNAGERTIGWDGVVGVGLTDSFSAALKYSLESNDYLQSDGDQLHLWVFWTVTASKIFDVDFFSQIGTGGGLAFGSELNLDLDKFGLQLTLEEGIENRIDLKGNPTKERSYNLGLQPLVHYALNDSTQLLAAIDFSLPHYPKKGERSFNIGSVGIGLNIGVHPAVELITELNIDIPQDDEKMAIGAMIGFLATVPATKN